MPSIGNGYSTGALTSRKRGPALFAVGLCLAIILLTLYAAFRIANDDGSHSQKAGSKLAGTLSGVTADPVSLTSTDPAQLQKVTPERAEQINAAIPIVAAANPAASVLKVDGRDASNFVRGLECMTDAIYYEAATEPVDGQRAVAQVILNRVRYPAYPHSICGVVYQGAERKTGCQFSFSCDGSLGRQQVAALRARARGVALAALGGFVYAPVGWATHYHADYVIPYWANTLVKSAVIGHHIFYRLSSSPRVASLFSAHYAEKEIIDPLMGTGPVSDAMLAPDNGATPLVTLSERPILSRQGVAMEGKMGNGAAGPTVTDSASASPSAMRWILKRPSAVSGASAAGTVAAGNETRPAKTP